MSPRLQAQSSLPLLVNDTEVAADIRVYEGRQAGRDYVVLLFGSLLHSARPPLVRIHSGCMTGDVFGSRRCECGEQLRFAIETICADGSGVVIYVPWHEGRGIGLTGKVRAYALQDRGADTVDANHLLGFSADSRTFHEAADILRELGIDSVRLMSNNPRKLAHLAARGVKTERVSMPSFVNPHNLTYLATKQLKLGHLPEGSDAG